MNADFIKEILKGVLTAAFIAVGASGVAVYVSTSNLQLEINHMKKDSKRIEKKVDKIHDSLEGFRRDIYRPSFSTKQET